MLCNEVYALTIMITADVLVTQKHLVRCKNFCYANFPVYNLMVVRKVNKEMINVVSIDNLTKMKIFTSCKPFLITHQKSHTRIMNILPTYVIV